MMISLSLKAIQVVCTSNAGYVEGKQYDFITKQKIKFMPYNGEESLAKVATEQQPRSQSVFERLKKLNEEQTEYLFHMEDKLHKIHSKRTPEKKPESEKMPEPIDFISAINSELDKMSSQTAWLKRLGNHISEIV